MLGLYIHIPFCGSICHYCDFIKKVPKDDDTMTKYIDKLIEELFTYQHEFKNIDTIFIGGGTPNYLSDENLERLLSALNPINPKEFTIEINPEYYTEKQGQIFRKYGINRVSIGAQTFDEKTLEFLNRQHRNQDVYNTVNSLKLIGIDNINIDLIFAIPNTDLSHIKKDVEEFIKLDVKHLSYYSLILEENTYFHYLYNRGQFHEVDQETSRQMYEYIIDTLIDNGYEHYEISNFSKPDYNSVHNKIYWHLEDYIGIGLGSHGLYKDFRYYNERAFNKYYVNTLYKKEQLTKEDRLSEELIMRLRLSEGVNIEMINDKYQIDFYKKFPKTKEMIDLKLLTKDGSYLKLTKEGLFLANQIFQIFV